MKNKVILITGALTGIGRATALAFAREGAHLVVCGRRDDVGNALATELRALGVEAEYIRADVRHEDDVRSLVDKTVKRFGRLDVAVNTAGTEGKPGPVMEQSPENYATTFDTNVLGTLLSLKHELRKSQMDPAFVEGGKLLVRVHLEQAQFYVRECAPISLDERRQDRSRGSAEKADA